MGNFGNAPMLRAMRCRRREESRENYLLDRASPAQQTCDLRGKMSRRNKHVGRAHVV